MMEHSRRHPGRLFKRLRGRLASLLAHGVEAMTNGASLLYYQSLMALPFKGPGTFRGLPEAKTLRVVLDFLAAGRDRAAPQVSREIFGRWALGSGPVSGTCSSTERGIGRSSRELRGPWRAGARLASLRRSERCSRSPRRVVEQSRRRGEWKRSREESLEERKEQ